MYSLNVKKKVKIKNKKPNKGDVILAHPFLAHRAGPNYSKDIRYAVFMRPARIDKQLTMSSMLEKDMWVEMPGLSDLTNSQLALQFNQQIVDNSKHNHSDNSHLFKYNNNQRKKTKQFICLFVLGLLGVLFLDVLFCFFRTKQSPSKR